MSLQQCRLLAAEASGGVSSSIIYDTVLATAAAIDPDPATILDYGSGTGQLIPLLAARFPNAQLHAADIMARPPALPSSVMWHQGDLNSQLSAADGSFEMILAVEVIEHLENPRHMLREVARLLARGGVALLSTPNTGSYRSLITLAARGHHAQFDDINYPAHITPIGAVDFERMGDEAGLDLVEIFYTNDGCIPKLLSRRWQQLPVIGPRLRGRRFSDNFGAVFRKRG